MSSKKSAPETFHYHSYMHISLHQIIVRDYDMVLGDHPNCLYGPPVTLGWHYLEYKPLGLNEYEYHHSRRRPLRQLILNYYCRKEILLTENSTDDLKKATKEKDRVNMQRSITRQLLPYWRVEEALESAGRKVKRIVKKGPSKNWWETEEELDWSRHANCTSKASILRVKV